MPKCREVTKGGWEQILLHLSLYIWASKSKDHIVSTLYQFMTRCSSSTLKNDREVLTPRVFYGEGFEMIHTWYSVLRLQLEGLVNSIVPRVRLLVLAPGQKVSKVSDITLELEMEDKLSGITLPFKEFLSELMETPHTTILLHLGGNFPDVDVLRFELVYSKKIQLTLQQHKHYTATVFDYETYKQCISRIEETWRGYRLPDKEFEEVEILIGVEFFILGKVSTTVPRAIKSERVHDTKAIETMYGPTLFSLVRPITNSWTE